MRFHGVTGSSTVLHLFLVALILASDRCALARGGPTGERARPVRKDLLGDDLPDGALVRMGSSRFRHGDEVHALAYSPDGSVIASGGGSYDSAVYLWNAATGQLVRRLTGHKYGVTSLCFSPDGKTLASVAEDRTIRLWHVATGKEVRQYQSSVGWSGPPVFAKSGSLLAAGDENGAIHIWDAAGGKEQTCLPAHKCSVAGLTAAEDGKSLISSGWDGSVRQWPLDEGASSQELCLARMDAPNVRFSPEAKALAWWRSGGKEAHLLDLSTGQERAHLGTGEEWGRIAATCFSPDGKYLAIASQVSIRLWEVASCKEIAEARKEQENVCTLAFSPDGKTLAAGDDRRIRLWRSLTAEEITTGAGGHKLKVVALSVSADGKRVASGGPDDTVRLWELESGKEVQQFRAPCADQSVCVAVDGKRVFFGCANGKIYAGDVSQGQVDELFNALSSVQSLSRSPDGKRLFCLGGMGGHVYAWDLSTGAPSEDFSTGWNDDALALSPDGIHAATVGQLQALTLWDLSTKTRIFRNIPEYGWLSAAAFSPDGDRLATGGTGGVYLWDVPTKQLLRRLRSAIVNSVAYSPDGKMLASGDESGAVRLWEAATGKLRREFVGHRGPVNAVAFCPDGNRLVSAGSDTTLLVWDCWGETGGATLQPFSGSEEDRRAAWTDLGSDDAEVGFRTIRALAAAPANATPFIDDQLRSLPQVDEGRVHQFLTDLDADGFEIRQAASQQLEVLGDGVEPFLREALTKDPSPEARRRIETLLGQLGRFDPPSDRLRLLRVIEALERIGTLGSRKSLELLSKEAPSSVVKHEASAALARIQVRNSTSP